MIDAATVRYSFKGDNVRDLPVTVAQLPILSKAYYSKVDFTKSTLEPPLGSGPYKVKAFKPGEYVAYERRDDYWAKDLPVNKGRNNFDEIRYEYFRERTAGLEALKSGVLDLREEYTSRDWATSYDFPAVKNGHVIKEVLPDETPSGAQGYFLNLRREKFQDIRVRQALNLAFDFEWSNANLFYGLYTRSRSYFNNSELEAKGLPSEAELALLEPLRDKVPPEVFTTEYTSPSNKTPQDRRKNLRAAQGLLAEAGWKAETSGNKQVLKNAKGETFAFTITLDSEAFQRVALPYVEQLALLGINANVRLVDAAQNERIEAEFDYDMIVGTWGQSLSPGNEQREFFGSEFADQKKSRNQVGIKNPAIDALIDKIVSAPDRASLITACRAMDRVLMWNHYVVPMWFKAADWIAYWKRVKHPGKMPGYSPGYPDIWWYDAEAAATLKKA